MAAMIPAAYAQEAAPTKTLSSMAKRIDTPIQLDGRLSEDVWGEATPAAGFVQFEPREGEPATERTEVRILFDDKNLYIGANCLDSRPDGIMVNSLKEDFEPNDADYFQVILDSLFTQRGGFLFTTNPLGAKRDSQVTDEGRTTNTDWDTVWDVRAQQTADGWSAEFVIPFKSLALNEGHEGQRWGINFARNIRRKNELDVWSPIPRRFAITRLSLAGELDGLGEIEKGRNLRLKPFTVAETNRLARNKDRVWKAKPGMDVKYSVTPSLTLDLTGNTDFSQVEVDEQQVNLTRFSQFFPEKREFFLENDGLFQLGDVSGERGPDRARETQLYFSRKIGLSDEGEPIPIWGGMRLSGQVEDYGVGLLAMQTKRANGKPGNNFAVARFRRNILSNSDVGVLFTNRQASEGKDYNRTWGADANFKFWQNLDLNGYVAQSATDNLKGENWTRKAAADWRDNNVRVNVIYSDVEQNFNPELGYVQRSGVRYFRSRNEAYIRRFWKSWMRQYRPHVYYTHQMDQQNRPVSKEGHYAPLEFQLQSGAAFEVFLNTFYERLDVPFRIRQSIPKQPDITIPAGDYHYSNWVMEANTDPSRMLSASMSFRTGEFYSGTTNQLSVTSDFRPFYQVLVQNRYNYNTVALKEGSFKTHLFRTRVDYYLSTRALFNAFIQYNSDRKQVTSNLRFNFIHHPLSDLFLVYNEAREVSGARRSDRAVTVKYTQLFSF
jgi:hypothetical protein